MRTLNPTSPCLSKRLKLWRAWLNPFWTCSLTRSGCPWRLHGPLNILTNSAEIQSLLKSLGLLTDHQTHMAARLAANCTLWKRDAVLRGSETILDPSIRAALRATHSNSPSLFEDQVDKALSAQHRLNSLKLVRSRHRLSVPLGPQTPKVVNNPRRLYLALKKPTSERDRQGIARLSSLINLKEEGPNTLARVCRC